MASYQEQALAYLKGEMNEADRAAFEETLLHSEELRAEVENSRALLDILAAANDEAVVRQVNACIQDAIRRRATDIHIVCERGQTVSYRIDGHLQEVIKLPQSYHQRVVDRWKVMAEMNLAERQLPQDGRISVRYDGKDYDLRVSIAPTVTGERITARIMDKKNMLIGLEKLGLSEAQIAAIHRILDQPRGFILVAGYEGNGKTTLLYSMLKAVNRPGRPVRNIMTIEDPVEYLLPGVSQMAVNRKAGLRFAAGLHTIMRSDPDVTYCSQLRDLESAELCIEQALTGQVVLSQLHVSSAIQVVQRLREMGVENFLIGYTLLGAVGVRLVRRICRDCMVDYMPEPEDLRKAGLSPVEDGPFRKGAGCAACRNTGFLGRIGLFEVLETNDVVRRMIIDQASLDAVWRETFGRNGGSLWDDAREKVRQGLTTVEEVTWALSDYPHPRSTLAAGLSLRAGILDLDSGQ